MEREGKKKKKKNTYGRHGMSRREQRERRSIHDPHALDANDPGPRVHHGPLVVPPAHSARRRSVPNGVEVPPDVSLDLSVGRDLFARVSFLADHEAPQRPRGEELAHALEARDGDVDVGARGQVVWVDERGDGRVGAGEGEVAAGAGRHERGGQGGVVGAVGRAGGPQVLHVAQVRGDGDVFRLGPVGGVGGQGGLGLVAPGSAEGCGDLFPGEDVGVGARVQARGFVVVQFGLLRGEGGAVAERREGDGVDAVCDVEEQVVLHPLSDARPVGDHWDLEALQGRGGADARGHEELGRIEGSRGQDHFLARGQDVGITRRIDPDASGLFVGVEEDLLAQSERVNLEGRVLEALSEK